MKPTRSMDGCDGFVCETGDIACKPKQCFLFLCPFSFSAEQTGVWRKCCPAFWMGGRTWVKTLCLLKCWSCAGRRRGTHYYWLISIPWGYFNGGWKCCWHWALWRQIFHLVSGTGIKIGAQRKSHVGKGAFPQESKLLWKMFYPKSHNHDIDFKSIKDHLWSLGWPTVQPTCPARAVHQTLPACFQLSSMDRPQQCGRQGANSWAQKCLWWTCPFCLWCVSVSQQTWWAAGLWWSPSFIWTMLLYPSPSEIWQQCQINFAQVISPHFSTAERQKNLAIVF